MKKRPLHNITQCHQLWKCIALDSKKKGGEKKEMEWELSKAHKKHWQLRNSTFGKDEGYRQIIKNPLNNFNQLNLIPKPHHSTLEAMSGHKENGKIKNSSTCEIANKPMSSKSASYCSSCGTIRDQSLKFTSFHETTKKRIRATRGRYIQFSTSSGNKKLCPLGTDALVWSDVYWNAWQIEMLLVWGGCILLGHAETKARPLTGAVFNHPSSNTSDVNLLPESGLCEVLTITAHISLLEGEAVTWGTSGLLKNEPSLIRQVQHYCSAFGINDAPVAEWPTYPP